MKENTGITEQFRNSPCYLLVFHNNGPIAAISDVFAADLGYSADEITQKKVEDILAPGSRIFFQTHFFPLLKLHGVYNELFLSFASRDGEEIPVLLNARTFDDGSGLKISAGGIRITKRNRYEQEILEAKRVAEKATAENEELVKAKKDLANHQEMLEEQMRKLAQRSREHFEISSVVSHDLQEPLRKVSVFGKLLLSDLPRDTKDNAQKYVQKIVNSAEHMRNLMSNIQLLIGTNEKNFKPVDCNLKEIIHSASETLPSAVKDVRVQLDPGIPENFTGDPEMLENLFAELFMNTYNFRDPKKPVLEVEVTADIVDENIYTELENRYQYEKFLRLQVKDNGLGFPQKLAEEIFRLFRKAHVVDSYGVGLAYCRKIVELHGGKIFANSEVGKGTTVTVVLPMSR